MDNNRRAARGASIGLASIVTVFAVLGMTAFAVLSLSTAAQEKKLAEKYAASVRDYWAADFACSETADALGALLAQGTDSSALAQAAARAGADCSERDGALFVDYAQPIDTSRTLCVSLRLDDTLTILSWRTQAADGLAWEPDSALPVWQGNTEELP